MDAKLQGTSTIPRPRLRFRLRSLFAFMALCAVASSFAGQINAYYAEQRALGELRTRGSLVVEAPLNVFL